MSEETISSKKNNGAFIAVILILTLMLGAMAYMWSEKNTALNSCNNKRKKAELENKQMTALAEEHLGDMSDNLLNDMGLMFSNYEELKQNGTEDQRQEIEAQQKQIVELMEKVRKGERTAAAYYEARKQNKQLREIMRGYVYEIDSLNTLNLNLQNNLDQTTMYLDRTSVERDSAKTLADQRNEKIKEGQRLIAYPVRGFGLRQKLGGLTSEDNKARRIVQIAADFTIAENALTNPGNKNVYLQVIDPSGKTLQNTSSNIITTENGKVPYSDKKSIDYRNQRIDVTVYYSVRGQELTRGNYKVQLFCQGQLIGKDSFTLK